MTSPRTTPAPAAARDAPSFRVAIIGAGPAGIYAGNILARAVQDVGGAVGIDLFDTLPAPYGLIRYGVAPDHPRIKGIVTSLHEMLDARSIRFVGNVDYGTDLTLDDLRAHYHAVIFATGAIRDAVLPIPGTDLPGCFGAADFVSWFDGHPDAPREWPLHAREVAVIGNGNVALDVARMLAKHADALLPTDIPENVYAGLAASIVTDVHVFGRRGPAQVKFTPIELRELGAVPDVDVVVYEEDFPRDEASEQFLAASSNQVKVMSRTLNGWLSKEPTGASRRLHLHFLHSPVEVYGDGRVEGMRFERTAPTGDRANPGGVAGTGEMLDYPLQAVYRAVGYRGSPLSEVPFDEALGVIPHDGGRVLDPAGQPVPGLYATGWIKRGPVGLIGHTKSDALETVTRLVDDLGQGLLPAPAGTDADGILSVLAARGIRFTDWDGWLVLDAHERALGAADRTTVGRERVKVVPRDEQVGIARARALVTS